jgi:hypothetical protein
MGLMADIIDRYEADPILSAVTGPFAYAAPVDSAYPYAYIVPMGKAVTTTYDDTRINLGAIQLKLYDTDIERLVGYHERVQTLFPKNWKTSTCLGALLRYENIDIVRDSKGEPALTETGLPVYYSVVRYFFTTQS